MVNYRPEKDNQAAEFLSRVVQDTNKGNGTGDDLARIVAAEPPCDAFQGLKEYLRDVGSYLSSITIT